jgi:hypothetical protein
VSIDTKASTAAEAPDPAERAPRSRRRVRKPLAFVLALGFFFGPAAGYVVGQRPQEIENRRLTAFPSVSQGWSFFPQFTSWATDHLPLRKQAVSGNSALSEGLFGQPPSYGGTSTDSGVAGVPGTAPNGSSNQANADKTAYPQVIQGKDGWLYLGSDVSGLCEPARSVTDTLARLTRLADAVRKSGRRFVLTIAPDKSSAWPRELPDNYLGKNCAEARRTQFWSALRADPPPGYVDLLGPIQAAERTNGAIYRQTDTHWGELGAMLYAKGVADALQPALWPRMRVVRLPDKTRTGDLGVLIGRPHVDTYKAVQLSRTVPAWDYTMPTMPLTNPVRVEAGPVPAGLPLITGPTLLLGDSFTNSSVSMIPQLFTSLTLLHNEAAAARPDVAATAMVNSDTVVYEIVERTIASGRGALIEDNALTAIEKALAANPR